MSSYPRLVAALAIGATTAGCLAGTGSELPRFEQVADDAAFPVPLPSGHSALRGYLVVAEDRAADVLREIRLPVVVVRGRRSNPTASPVLYLSGGPGVGSLDAATYSSAYPWTADRDFVVFGQRGTQHSQPALDCDEYREALSRVAGLLKRAESRSALVEAAASCRSRLAGMGIDLSAYHSAATAADVEDLRRVLGVDQWTLYGLSYGTRVALSIARDYPQRVRAMILDSPLPPHVRYDDESASHFEAALGAILQDCADTTGCTDAFPNLRERFFTALGQADENPISVTAGPEGVVLSLSAPALAALVDTGSPQGIVEAPYLMDAIARGDSAAIATAAGRALGFSDFAWGMRFSVWCSESLPFSQRASSPPGPVLGGLESAAVAPEVCEAWTVDPRPQEEAQRVSSDVPTLLFAGQFDAATPPVWAESAAETLSRSRVVVVRGEGHIPTQQWGGDGCAMQLAAHFVRDPVGTLTSSWDPSHCVLQRQGPEYATGSTR